jgi:hypothetical protein
MQKFLADEEDVSEPLWVPYPLTSDGIPFRKKETLLALCELSQLFRRLLHHNKAEDMADGSHEDISIRVGIYRELLDLKATSPIICDGLTESPAHTYTLTLVHSPSRTLSSNSSLTTVQVLLQRNRALGLPAPTSAAGCGSTQWISYTKRPLL